MSLVVRRAGAQRDAHGMAVEVHGIAGGDVERGLGPFPWSPRLWRGCSASPRCRLGGRGASRAFEDGVAAVPPRSHNLERPFNITMRGGVRTPALEASQQGGAQPSRQAMLAGADSCSD